MQAEHRVGRGIVERALLEHQARPAALAGRRPLLGGLEQEQHRAGQLVAHARERLGDAEQDRGVRVVAARVHHADLVPVIGGAHARRERQPGLLGDRQRVHVGAQRDDRALRVAAQHRHHARVRDAGAHAQAELAQLLGDDPGGALLAVAELGMLVQIAAPLDHARHRGARRAVDGVAQLVAGRRQRGERQQARTAREIPDSRVRTVSSGWRLCRRGGGSAVFDPVRWPREAWVPLASWDRVEYRRLSRSGCPGACSRCCPARSCSARARACCSIPATAASRTSPRSARVLGVLLAPFALAFAGADRARTRGSPRRPRSSRPATTRCGSTRTPKACPSRFRPPGSRPRSAIDEAMLGTMVFTQLFPSVERSPADRARGRSGARAVRGCGMAGEARGLPRAPVRRLRRRHRAAPHARLRLRAPVVPQRIRAARRRARPRALARLRGQPHRPRLDRARRSGSALARLPARLSDGTTADRSLRVSSALAAPAPRPESARPGAPAARAAQRRAPQRRRLPRRRSARHDSRRGAGDVGSAAAARVGPLRERSADRRVRPLARRLHDGAAGIARRSARVRDRGHSRGGLRAHVLPARRALAGARRAARRPFARRRWRRCCA